MTTMIESPKKPKEQTRARYPDREGYVARGGVRVFYEVYGEGERTILFLPTWSIVHSRVWKSQIPYFARHFRVITFDPRGNGKSDRPVNGYSLDDHYGDALAVIEAAGVERTAVVGWSDGGNEATMLAALHPDLVERLVLVGFATWENPPEFWLERDSYEGWQKYSASYWREDYEGFLRWFFARVFKRAALDEADRGRGRLGTRDEA